MTEPIRIAAEAMKNKTIITGKEVKPLKFPELNEWITCPKCTKEMGGLMLSGLCFDCDRDKERETQKEALRAAALVSLLGEKPITGMSDAEQVRDYAKHLDWKYNLQRYQVLPGTKAAVNYVTGFNPLNDSLYLWSWCGSGKTYLAYCLAKNLFDRGYKGEILNPRQLIRKLRGRSGYEEEAIIQHYIALDFLVLDDLGVDSDTPYAVGSLCEIIEGRTRATIATSNLSLDDLALRLKDNRLSSRLNGKCSVFKLEPREADGKEIDWRGKLKKTNKLAVI